jgi:hypothetical protein
MEERRHAMDAKPLRGLACPHCGGVVKKALNTDVTIQTSKKSQLAASQAGGKQDAVNDHACGSPHCCIGLAEDYFRQDDLSAKPPTG